MSRKNSGPLFFKATKKPTAVPSNVELQLTISKLSAEGRGIAYRDNKAIFVANALPGETVRAKLLVDKREFAEAEVVAVIEPSLQRIEPDCALFGRCGGCQLQMLDIAAQREHKQQTLRHLLKAFLPNDLSEAIVAAPWHYRHRARLAVAEHNDKPVLGFKSAHSHRVLAVPECPLLNVRLQPLLSVLPQWLEQLSQWRRIDEVLIAVDSNGKLALAWNAQRAFPKADAEKLTALCQAVNVQCNDAALIYELPSQKTLFKFTSRDFTQVNPAVNDLLAQRVVEWLQPGADDTVADFFCGLGNFTLPLARTAKNVVGFESSATMLQRAAENAEKYVNAEFRALDLFENATQVGDEFTQALLDPPRAGAKALCEQLATMKKLRRIVYVSCNPHTLVRDLGILTAAKFKVEQGALVDMFPQTGHIEAVIRLSR